jgi:diguanylate cyclase (GGDEF)-like protein
MSKPQEAGGTARAVLQGRTDVHLARRSHVAGAALVVVLLGVSTFAMWSSLATSSAITDAVAANAVSDAYAQAANAVGSEESLERKYRLEPGPEVRARFDSTAAALVTALELVRNSGDAKDRAVVDKVLAQHGGYIDAINSMFSEVDRGNAALTLKIDSEDVDPVFGSIETAVLEAAAARHDAFLAQVTRLHHLQALIRWLTPLVFITGLVLAALLASITRGHRRLLVFERTQAVHDSLHDALTGLPNRTLLARRCALALHADRDVGTRSALLLIDLDRFKEINDTFGHQHGDELLRQVGARLATAVRDVDTVARLGGDEFGVLVIDVGGATDAHQVATQLRDALEAPFHVAGVDLDVEASVGLVVSGDNGTDASTLLQHADIAMYVAKARNCGIFAYDRTVDGHSPAKLALLGDLRRALDRDELSLHYQPKVSLSTGDVVGVEALVRWQHPMHGLLMPDEFVPLAEHTGLIEPLTRHVFNTALAQSRIWIDSGRRLTVAVNLSARNLLDPHLPLQIAELLSDHGVPAELLEIEVTESALMTDPGRAQRLLEELSTLGIKIAIDDFGAGYTSLGQLRTLPVSELKIDRSFVVAMTADPGSAVIVQSVVELGHNLGLTIVAEGVETEHTLTALSEIGCDVAQGYLVSRPISADAVEAWCVERSAQALRGAVLARVTLP